MGKQVKSISTDLPRAGRKVVGVHLLNDFSGSPLVFSNVMRGLRQQGIACDVHTGRGRDGFLSELDVNYRYFSYRFFQNKVLRLFAYCWSQILLFCNMLAYRQEDVVIYVNTLLPFGAVIAGKLMGKPVVMHIHESSLKPFWLKYFLKTVAAWSSNSHIFVSHWLRKTEQIPGVVNYVVHNGLPLAFCRQADLEQARTKAHSRFTCLMLCSLKSYKGLNEYVQLATAMPRLRFELVVNANEKEIEKYFSSFSLPQNLKIYPTTKNVHPHYAKAHLVLNLSHTDAWIETFGMTILEGLYYGLPCIVPPVGGPTELIKQDHNGYLIDCRELEKLVGTIDQISTDEKLYQRLSQAARRSSFNFIGSHSVDQTIGVLTGKPTIPVQAVE